MMSVLAKRTIGAATVLGVVLFGFLPVTDAQWHDWGRAMFPVFAGLFLAIGIMLIIDPFGRNY